MIIEVRGSEFRLREDRDSSRLLIVGLAIFNPKILAYSFSALDASNIPSYTESNVLSNFEIRFNNKKARMKDPEDIKTFINWILRDENSERIRQDNIFDTYRGDRSIKLKDMVLDVLFHLARNNNINLPSDGAIVNKLTYLFVPAIKEFHSKFLTLNYYDHYSYASNGVLDQLPPEFFEANSFKEVVKLLTGTDSPRMIKALSNMKWSEEFDLKEMYSERRYIPPPTIALNSGITSFTEEMERRGFKHLKDTTFRKEEVRFGFLLRAKFLSKLLPLNYVYEMLEGDDPFKYGNSAWDSVTDTLQWLKDRNYSFKRLKAILNTTKGYLTDVVRMHQEYDTVDKIPEKLRWKYPNGIKLPEKPKDMKELHDAISAQHNEIHKVSQNKEIKYSEIELKLDNLQINENIKLVLPKETQTLVDWGALLKHCIASYGDKAVKKDCVLIGVEVDGELKYNVEVGYVTFYKSNGLGMDGKPSSSTQAINKADIRQFRGLQNCTPPLELSGLVNQVIIDTLSTSKDDDYVCTAYDSNDVAFA